VGTETHQDQGTEGIKGIEVGSGRETLIGEGIETGIEGGMTQIGTTGHLAIIVGGMITEEEMIPIEIRGSQMVIKGGVLLKDKGIDIVGAQNGVEIGKMIKGGNEMKER
jgi:hypothetical protein